MHRFAKLAPALLVLALPGAALAEDRPETAVIQMQGTGEVSAAPDMAYVTSGVVTQAENARDALTANTKAMSQLIEVLKSAGIEDRDIQTSNFSVQPQYVYSDRKDENGYTQPPKISGYQVSNQVTVKVRDLDNLGAVLDKAVTVGANSINGVSFDVSNTDALYEQARKDAMADAMAKAKLYTSAAHVELGRILSISEQTVAPPQPYMARAKTMAMDMEAAPVPMQGGEMTYDVNVNVSWEIDQ